jgi:hypothetical protein
MGLTVPLNYIPAPELRLRNQAKKTAIIIMEHPPDARGFPI